MTASETVLSSLDAGGMHLTRNRPDKLNSFNEEMHLALPAQIRQTHGDTAIRAVLLSGAGRAF